MNKLAALVLKHKAAKHGIPEGQGWMTRAEAARQLGEPERKVHDLLRDAIAAKDIIVGKFSIWDAAGMRPMPVTCYRIAGEKTSTPAPVKALSANSELEEAIIRIAESRPLRARGLKRYYHQGKTHGDVAPLAGARIETHGLKCAYFFYSVAPLAGARIETICA